MEEIINWKCLKSLQRVLVVPFRLLRVCVYCVSSVNSWFILIAVSRNFPTRLLSVVVSIVGPVELLFSSLFNCFAASSILLVAARYAADGMGMYGGAAVVTLTGNGAPISVGREGVAEFSVTLVLFLPFELTVMFWTFCETCCLELKPRLSLPKSLLFDMSRGLICTIVTFSWFFLFKLDVSFNILNCP